MKYTVESREAKIKPILGEPSCFNQSMPPLKTGNLLQLPLPLPLAEQFEVLETGQHLRIERIISSGQITPPHKWFDQDLDEWVILLQGEAILMYEDGTQSLLKTGDYLFIPAHCRHRVEFTSTEPPCIWLAVHATFDPTPKLEEA
jgi:cupin 2 domain-containing protein